jgi:hypothetical protein
LIAACENAVAVTMLILAEVSISFCVMSKKGILDL